MRLSLQFLLGLAASVGLSVLLLAAPDGAGLRAEQTTVAVTLFWQEGCPYCAEARDELERLAETNPAIQLEPIEIGVDAAADALFERTLLHFEFDTVAVPLVVIGDRSFLGFLGGGHSAAQYDEAIRQCLGRACPDLIADLARGAARPGRANQSDGRTAAEEPSPTAVPDLIHVPLIGEVRPRDLSLPALTVLLAAVDGFNPCAMWVLVFLIGLLLGLKDEKRMWLLGGAFLAATAVMYLAVMAAWLNLILFLGAVIWVRLAIGALAVGSGVYFLREYWTKPEAVCVVTNPTRREMIMSAFRSVVTQNQLALSVLGIMALAVLVNFIELLCSAGVPAVYTQILALSDLTRSAYYAYLGLYIAVFMLDDVAIFATAMIAVRVSGLTGKYARLSHLIGGVVLLSIGAVMLLRPELLSFS